MARLYNWLTDPQRNWKIFGSRLNDEFDNIFTGGSVSNQTGTSYTYITGDSTQTKKRSNSGAFMVDTLPGTGTAVMASGWWVRVVNTDTAGILAVGVASGANLDGNATGFYIYLGPGQGATIISDGSNYFAIEKPDRCRLGATTTFFCGGTGSSASNAGLTTGTGALATIQSAINLVGSRLDMNGQACVIQIADGNYTENLTLIPYLGRGNQGHTTGPVMIQGNSGAITNVSLQPASGDAVTAVETGGFEWGFQNLKIAPPAGNGINVDAGSWVSLNAGITFGATTQSHAVVQNGGLFEPNAAYTIAGGAAAHLLIHDEGKVLYAGQTVTLTGTPAFSSAFVTAVRRGSLQALGVTFSGAATGTRWARDAASYFGISGSADSLFPGNANGIVSPPWAVSEGGTGDTGTAWTTYSPTVTAQTPGVTPPTFTVNTARYKQLGKTVFVEIDITVTAAGTGAGQIDATLPVTAAAAGYYLTGLDRGLTAKAVWAAINGGGSSSTTLMAIAFYDGTTAIATNSRPAVSGVYEAA